MLCSVAAYPPSLRVGTLWLHDAVDYFSKRGKKSCNPHDATRPTWHLIMPSILLLIIHSCGAHLCFIRKYIRIVLFGGEAQFGHAALCRVCTCIKCQYKSQSLSDPENWQPCLQTICLHSSDMPRRANTYFLLHRTDAPPCASKSCADITAHDDPVVLIDFMHK